jgi:isoleucyl-tRNA synthetase
MSLTLITIGCGKQSQTGGLFGGSSSAPPPDSKAPIEIVEGKMYVEMVEPSGTLFHLHRSDGWKTPCEVTPEMTGANNSPVDIYGKYTNEVSEYEGINIFKANPLIVERLQESGHLLAHKEIEHSYPHCWRSKTPLIFRATPQWFMKMDDEKFNVRAKAQKAITEIQFTPDWGVKRLTAMIDNRPDWCLSRQRNWGVPIPAFTCEGCGEIHFTSETLMRVADVMEKNNGIEAYFEMPVDELVPGLTCTHCGSKAFTKNKDILDVWFDSGVCHAAVQKKRDGLTVPADLYLEGSDQHRGWFQTSLLSSIASSDQAPFKMLLTHNFVNDAKGRKMSKSLGNVVDPLDLIKKNGAEILRLWAASEDYGQDLNFSNESYNRVIEVYRRLRNSMKFILGSLFDFDPHTHLLRHEDLLPLDQQALHRLNELNRKMVEYCDQYEFFRAMQALNNYFTVELSAHYLDLLKDRLYTFKTDGRERRSAHTALWHILGRTCRMMAPFASFLAEETYQHLNHKEHDSVFLCDYPEPEKQWHQPRLNQDYEKLFELRSQVMRLLEEQRKAKTLGSSLEAQLVLSTSGEWFTLLQKFEPGLCEFFIVSQVKLIEDKGSQEVGIRVLPAAGEKCPRCWNYSEQLGLDPDYKEVCPKCLKALK